MAMMIVLALLNGVCISLSRVINGRLSVATNAFSASWWNHLVGFLFLTPFLLYGGEEFSGWQAPWAAYCGGALGALFVAINSYVLPRIGTLPTTLLVISGQMLAGAAIDGWRGMTPAAGVGLILLGVYLAKTPSQKAVSP